MWWEQVGMPWMVRRFKLDLMHTTTDRLPLLDSRAYVLTLFEIPTYRLNSYRRLVPNPRLYHRLSDTWTRLVFPLSLRRAKLILAASWSTKRDLEDRFGTDAGKIRVVYPSLDERFRLLTDVSRLVQIRRRYSTDDGYVLHFSSDDPRDNTPAVLKAFGEARKSLPGDVKLLIKTGSNETHRSWLRDRVRDLRLDSAVVIVGFVDDTELIELYQAAKVYVDPSLYEGFGLQVAEAMACGVPVITSNVTSLPEIVGDAGILVPSTDAEALADSLVRVLSDRFLRESMRRQGLDQIKRFSWQRLAREALDAYDFVLSA
jgi:glycosyltransferase involved in cell wall biosynthesis